MTQASTRPSDGHERYRLLAAGSIDGRLSPDESRELERHLAGCAACRGEALAMRADHAWLRVSAPATLPPARVREAVMDAARSARVPRLDVGRPWAALVAATLVIAVVGSVALAIAFPRTVDGPGGPGSPSPSTTPSLEPTRASPPNFGVPVATPMPLARETPAGPCAPVFEDLAAWWPGDPGGLEVVGGQAAILRSGATTGPGLIGSAFEFDGRSAYAEVPASASLSFGTADYTVLLWVRFDDLRGERVLVEQWVDPEGDIQADGWTLTKLADDVLLITSEQNGAGQSISTPHLAFEPGVWYHVAARRAGRDLYLYVNGQEVGHEVSGQPPIDVGADRPLLFGRRGNDRGFLLDGALDEVQVIVGRALFQSDIQAQYLAGSTGTCPTEAL